MVTTVKEFARVKRELWLAQLDAYRTLWPDLPISTENLGVLARRVDAICDDLAG